MSGQLANQIVHGARVKLYPDDVQAAQFDLWRRRCRSLWNLLLGIEQAAYSGEKFRPELKWRQKWVEVSEDTFSKLQQAFEAGKRPKAPEAVTDERRLKMLGRKRADGEPKLFLWEDELKKVMARLKQEPFGQWIGEIHSHAAQRVAVEVVGAIRAMLRERKKRVSGQGGQDTGFPRFKKVSAYAEGSVYFANTQIEFNSDCTEIKFPGGLGNVPFSLRGGHTQDRKHGRRGELAHIPAGAKIMNGRLYRIGETWWLSVQFQFDAPQPLPKTGRECGLKVSASIIATAVDNYGAVQQVKTPREPARHAFQMHLASNSLSRRTHGTKAYYKQAAKLAYQHARNRNVRDDCLHKTSRSIVNMHDAISVQKMRVKEMMRKDPEEAAGPSLRKANRAAAMAKFRGLVEYKAREAGRLLNETHPLRPIVQECSTCKKLNYMPLSKQTMACQCGNVLERRINAAMNEFQDLQIAKRMLAAE